MPTVSVIMSTFNATENIYKQIDSIFNQVNVDVQLIIRDDCSNNNTISLIKEYQRKHKNFKIILLEGKKNLGYSWSFLEALRVSPSADYYAFSDQDDVWKNNKLNSLIKVLNADSYTGPKLGYSKMQRSDVQLRKLNEQVNVMTPDKLTKKLVLTQTYNYGAATIINDALRKLVIRTKPYDSKVPHDLWVGILGYWFGRVYFVNQDLYYWIRYTSSVTGEGTKKSGIKYRIQETKEKQSYPNVSKELLDHYSDKLTKADKKFLKKLINYKYNFKDKMFLMFDSSFRRKTVKGTLMLKAGIMCNWF